MSSGETLWFLRKEKEAMMKIRAQLLVWLRVTAAEQHLYADLKEKQNVET